MAIDEPDVIDAMGIHRGTGDIVLTIADHLEWDLGNQHLVVLQEKINRYLGFIESGEIYEHRVDAEERRIRIDVCCRFTPSPDGIEFLSRAQAVIEEAGWLFTWRMYPDLSDDRR